MNILFISPSIPSRLHRIRSFELIKILSKTHKVHVVSLDVSNGKDIFPDDLVKIVASYHVVNKSKWKSIIDCLIGFFSFTPLEVAYCRSKKMKDIIEKVISEENIDIIYVKRLRSAQFVKSNNKLPVLLDTTDAMSLFYKRAMHTVSGHKKLLYFHEYLKYFLYEKKISNNYSWKWIACSPIDADYLKNNNRELDIQVISNPIDIEYFSRDRQVSVEPHSIMFSGIMDKFVNIEAALFLIKKIYPLVIDVFPDAKLYIIGPDPISSINKYKSENIIVTGYVEDIREYISKVEVVVCPIKTGTGVRNKILQAWALGKAVVSTTAGLEGLEGVNNMNVLLADDADVFAGAIIRLFNDSDIRDHIGMAGKATINEKYSSEIISQKLEYVFFQRG